jgi:hypothetical protein
MSRQQSDYRMLKGAISGWLARLVVVALLASVTPTLPADPVSDATALAGGIKAVSGELKRLANDALQAGDQVLYNRIEQAINGLALLLPKLEEVIRTGGKTANEVIDNASRDTLTILGTLHVDGASAGNFASAKLNTGLASASALLASVPFVDVPPAVFAVSPTRIDATQKGRRIRVYGYLPGEINDDVQIYVNGRQVDAQRGSGGSVAFTLPSDLVLKQEEEIPIRIEATEHYGWFNALWTTHKFNEVVLVGKAQPFTCSVESFKDNPSYLSRVTATGAMEFDASTQGGQNRPNEDRTVNADDLFAATMGDAARDYDPRSVVVKETGFVFQRWGQCGGAGPSGTAEILASGKAVRVRLSAKSLGDSVHRDGLKITVCHAGGTHAHGTLKPVFLAARRDAQPLLLEKAESYRLGSAGLNLLYPMPPAAAWSVHAKCTFKEASENWTTQTMIMNPQDTQETARGLIARLVDGRLLIEPLDPLRFDDQLR